MIVRRTGLLSGMGPSFSFIMFRSSIDIRPQHNVSVDKDAHRISGPDRQGRLECEIFRHNALSGLIRRVVHAISQPDDDAVIALSTIVGSQLARDAEQRREYDAFEQPPGVVIDPVLDPGIAFWVANTTDAFFRRNVFSHSRIFGPKTGSSSRAQASSSPIRAGEPSSRRSMRRNRYVSTARAALACGNSSSISNPCTLASSKSSRSASSNRPQGPSSM